jgi:RimJ/RimL family protein N-acetyltransferase/succinyl-CoA synthetase alpha subunit
MVLADGGTAHVRPIRPEDAPLLRAFHDRLSPESLYLRFFSPHPRLSEREVAHFTQVDHDARVALVVVLGEELIAVARYDRLQRSDEAEVAVIVADEQHGRGIASALLERLASAARERGVHQFTADVLPQNRAMLHVFHDAGFEVTSRFEDGVVRVSFPIDRTPEHQAAALERERLAQARSIERLLTPRGIGVIADGPEGARAEAIARNLEAGGFAGPVRRLPASAPGGDTEGLDLVFVGVAPELWPAQIERCGAWGVHAAVILASEDSSEEAPVARGDRALAARARRDGLRLLGPSSLGLAQLSSGQRLEGVVTPVKAGPGSLALFIESPQRGRDALDAVAARGLGLSSFLSAGRKADVSASDALQFWEGDASTEVIALVLRSLGNPRRSTAIVRRVSRKKPVLVWIVDAPAPPTAEFADALLRHTGAIRCDSLDDLFDVASALEKRRDSLRPDVAPRIRAWESWSRREPESAVRIEGVDPFAARCLVDEELARSPLGLEPAAGVVSALLETYGIDARLAEGTATAHPRLRVSQVPAWGSLLMRETAEGVREPRLLPITERDVHDLASPGPRAAQALRADLVRRLAVLAFDLPELASLALMLPSSASEQLAFLDGSVRLAPWTLGLAVSETGAA